MEDDDRLIADLARDLDGAFEPLVLAHQDRLYTLALRVLGDPRDAEEAVQDGLVRAYRALSTYDPTRIRALRLRGWLTTIVLNRCRSIASRRPAGAGRAPGSALPLEPAVVGGREPTAPTDRSPAALADRRAERELWAQRLAALPLAYRTAIVVRHVDGLSYPEAALALDRPEGTVKAQVHRGLAMLRTMLEAESVAEHGLERQEIPA